MSTFHALKGEFWLGHACFFESFLLLCCRLPDYALLLRQFCKLSSGVTLSSLIFDNITRTHPLLLDDLLEANQCRRFRADILPSTNTRLPLLHMRKRRGELKLVLTSILKLLLEFLVASIFRRWPSHRLSQGCPGSVGALTSVIVNLEIKAT